ncbi:MAG: (Fe-S)-binding protein [Methylococcales bacterium]|nr:(Fe-S)-binding protein [Methylococcales bacterium]
MKLFLDWSDYQNAGMGDAYADIPKQAGNFAKAVAVCIGSKQCETHNAKGVMCPSFRVTGNPHLSTGGRVKLLKTALNAINDDKALFDAQLVEAMNECVSCKGCKRECENEVDMALIKAEYLAQFNQKHGIPLRRKLFANLPKLARFPALKQLVTWRNRSPFIAKMTENFLGISAKAPLPIPANQTLSKTEKFTSQSADSTREVVLFVDTFNRNFNPQVVEAALNLLSTAGYQVEIASAANDSTPLCCGRTYFSNGMISEAKNEATRLLHALEPHIDAGRWIIGLESSCILSLRDEYLKLDLGDAAKKLAERVLLLEEFVAREQTAKRWTLNFKLDNERMLVHGHCHQKAVGAMKAMRKVLKTVEGLDFELIETSCCGMAGHFGLEAEHYETSQAMAQQALFPTLRAEPKVGIIANGFSCQQQIGNGGFEKPRHIAEVLYTAVS